MGGVVKLHREELALPANGTGCRIEHADLIPLGDDHSRLRTFDRGSSVVEGRCPHQLGLLQAKHTYLTFELQPLPVFRRTAKLQQHIVKLRINHHAFYPTPKRLAFSHHRRTLYRPPDGILLDVVSLRRQTRHKQHHKEQAVLKNNLHTCSFFAICLQKYNLYTEIVPFAIIFYTFFILLPHSVCRCRDAHP